MHLGDGAAQENEVLHLRLFSTVRRVRKTNQNLQKTPAHKELNFLTILTVTILELAGQITPLMKILTMVEETTIILMIGTMNTNMIPTRQEVITDIGEKAETDLMGLEQDLKGMINLFQIPPTRMNIMMTQQRTGMLTVMIPDFRAVPTDIGEMAEADLMGLDQDLKEVINLFQIAPTRMNMMTTQQRVGVLMGMIPDFRAVLTDIEEKAGTDLMGLDRDLKEMTNLFQITPTRMNIMMTHQKTWTTKTNETATNVMVEGIKGDGEDLGEIDRGGAVKKD